MLASVLPSREGGRRKSNYRNRRTSENKVILVWTLSSEEEEGEANNGKISMMAGTCHLAEPKKGHLIPETPSLLNNVFLSWVKLH
jgi:hypothetical protein